jgi:hydrogenase assembly chaperone HypC/HupF
MVDGYADQVAMVDVVGKAREVNVGMLERAVAPGEWVMLHLGFAVEIVDQEQAERAMAGLEMMGRSLDDASDGWSS